MPNNKLCFFRERVIKPQCFHISAKVIVWVTAGVGCGWLRLAPALTVAPITISRQLSGAAAPVWCSTMAAMGFKYKTPLRATVEGNVN